MSERELHRHVAGVIPAVADEDAFAVTDVTGLAREVQVRGCVLQRTGTVSASLPDGLARP